MRFSLFPGCKIPFYVPQYEISSRKVLEQFDIGLENIEFNCCGYPVRFLNFKSFVLSSARNIALAGEKGHPLLCLCKCCYGTLRYADILLRKNEVLFKEINKALKAEGLQYPKALEIKHLLNVLYEDIDPETIKGKNVRPLKGLKVAAHYGCHILRPHDVVQFDDPVNPNKFEKLIELTGASSVDWLLRLQCCGDPQHSKNDVLSQELGEEKFKSASEAGAEILCVGCTHCQMQFDRVGAQMREKENNGKILPSILYPQLLGLSLGLEASVLGIDEKQPGLSNLFD